MSDNVHKELGFPQRVSVLPALKSISSSVSLLPTSFSPKSVEQHLSVQTNKVLESIRRLEASSPSTTHSSYQQRETREERLFDVRANVKILLSQVSMHFSQALREKLFIQLDRIHDPDDWEDEDNPIQLASFKTFLRWYYVSQPSRLPSFGLSSNGHFIASWLANTNRDRLILEYLSNDRVKWFVTKYFADEADHSAGLSSITRIPDVLAPYDSATWYTRSA